MGLGACLADDMGLGKTVQVLSLLLALKEGKTSADAFKGAFFLSYDEFMDKYRRRR